ncbi:MAG: rhodanese-like domain-containing protein [Methylotenera sp.]|nr:rhodanese-like domain-containing protein [Methylotenera sp.]MDP1755466.1 rhodanese-like domain-containing protein [Methylotenera sp.]MDP1960317.1 rhodanese-like domain-containing protein [Methylotenera sp.]MDP3304079.1 rhodanese-like domain-containing protein [Methylotenera sp.]MDP3942194.1 rhodanese-like domain-containing protein [Methylotenera sp.]
MSHQQEVLATAQQRAVENNLPYAGALTPQEAFIVLQENLKALLVDVRTQAELALVGRVPAALNVEWAFYPGMVANTDFAEQLVAELNRRRFDRDSLLIFMCRTGGRSNNAATVAASLGFTQAYNTLEGFEGEANSHQQRTLINGWKHAGLPWTN